MASRIASELDGDGSRKSSAALLVTIWELGEAAGPLLIAPLAEMFGRWPVYNTAIVLFMVAIVFGALSHDMGELYASRALTGMAVASNVLNPAIVGDMFPSEQRGAAMSCIMFAPLVASSVGPAVSSMIADSLGWRSVLWISLAFAALCELAFFTRLPETYKISILRQKVTRPCKETDDAARIQSLSEELNLMKSPAGLWASMMRPAGVFFGSGVLAALSLFGSLMYSYFYVTAVTIPSILEDVYKFPPSMTGSAFLANGENRTYPFSSPERHRLTQRSGIGSVIGVGICRLALDRIYIKLSNTNNGVGLPEYRLPLTIVGVITMSPAVALYGWCAEYRLRLPMFLLSIVWIRASMTLAFLPIMPYVVDACGLYSATALTGVIVIRCLAGAFLPLAAAKLIEHRGYGWGFNALAMASLIAGLIPVLILRYGSRWRQSSKYTRTGLGQ